MSSGADASTAEESGALLAKESLLPEGEATLLAPVYIVECSGYHLALHSRWYAPFITLAPIAALGPPVLALVCVFAWIVFADPLKVQLARQPTLELAVLFIIAVTVVCIIASGLVFWTVMKRHGASGPIHFDRDSKQLLFGQISQQQTRPLSTITAVQLISTTQRALLEKEAAHEKEAARPAHWLVRVLECAFSPRRNWQDRLINYLATWREAKSVVYQLNVVFADGSRLNLTDWKKRHLIEALAQRLAEFLKVPLTIQEANLE